MKCFFSEWSPLQLVWNVTQPSPCWLSSWRCWQHWSAVINMSVNSFMKSFHTQTHWSLFCLLGRPCFHHSWHPWAQGWDLVSPYMIHTRDSSLQLIREQVRAVNVPNTDTVNPTLGLHSHLTNTSTRTRNILDTFLWSNVTIILARNVKFEHTSRGVWDERYDWYVNFKLNQQGFLK